MPSSVNQQMHRNQNEILQVRNDLGEEFQNFRIQNTSVCEICGVSVQVTSSSYDCNLRPETLQCICDQCDSKFFCKYSFESQSGKRSDDDARVVHSPDQNRRYERDASQESRGSSDDARRIIERRNKERAAGQWKSKDGFMCHECGSTKHFRMNCPFWKEICKRKYRREYIIYERVK